MPALTWLRKLVKDEDGVLRFDVLKLAKKGRVNSFGFKMPSLNQVMENQKWKQIVMQSCV